MLQSKLFKSFIITLFVVGFLEFTTIQLHLLSTISWFDMVMHFCGGFFIGMFILWIITWGQKKNFSYGELLVWGVGTALIVGVLWEIFELNAGLTDWYSPDYLGDNGMDMVMDITGGLIAVWFGHFKLKKHK